MTATSSDAVGAVHAVLAAFPVELCTRAAPDEAVAAHLQSVAYREAPLLVRSAAAAFGASDSVTLAAALSQLHEGLHRRAAWPGATPPPARLLELLRSLFLCAVLLHHECLATTSSTSVLVGDLAAPCLASLAAIALGAVALPQLEVLEELLLSHLGERGALQPLLLELVHAPAPRAAAAAAAAAGSSADAAAAGVLSAAADARRRLAFRWAAACLALPAAAPQLWPVLHALLDASLLSVRAADADGGGGGGGADLAPCADLLHSALRSLRVEVPLELEAALGLVAWLHSRCLDGLDGRNCGGAAGARAPSCADAGCALLFSLLPSVREPLLPPLLSAARQLASVGGAAESRCALLLRESVCGCPIGERKQALTGWLMELRAELAQRDQQEPVRALPPAN